MSVVLPIETDDRFRKYVASAGQTVFAVPFPFQDNADIAALLQNATTGDYTELSSTLYTLTGAGNPSGGSLAFLAGRVEDEVILILGRAVLERLSSVVRDGAFSSKLIDGEMDRNRIIQQELARDAARALKMEFGGGPGLTMSPDLVDGQVLMKLGDRLVPGPDAGDIAGAQGFAAAAAVLAGEAAADAAAAAAAAAALPPITNDRMLVDEGGQRTLKDAAGVRAFLSLANTTRAFATAAALLLAVVPEDNIVVADVPMKADASGTFVDGSGKKFKPAFWVTPRLFGAVGDGAADDKVPVQNSWDAAGLFGVPVLMEGREYNCSEEVYTSSNLTVHGQNAVMYITAWTVKGGFINNGRTDPLERPQWNIRIYDLITDGSKLPAPTTGQNINLGPEFGRGARDIIVMGCTARYVREGSGGGTGGGGFGGESGLENVHFINCLAHDCYRGYRVAGKTGTNVSDGTARFCVNVTFTNCTAKRCGAAIFAHAVGEGGNWTESNLSIFDAFFDGFYAEDCGHQGWFAFPFATYPTISPQKSGVFVFGGAQNIRMRGLRVKLNSTYPASFTDYTGRSGYPASGDYLGVGLSGPVGALFWGWGRNIVVEDVTIDGITDVIWKCARAQAMGDLATIPPVGSYVNQNVFNVRQIRAGGYLYVFDGGDIGANLMDSINGCVVRMTPNNAPATGVVGPSGTVSQPNLMIEFISNAGKHERGSADEWKAQGNVRPTSPQSTHFKGGLDLAGGYSSTGAKFGLTYDGASGVERSSHMVTTTAFHRAFYNPNGLVGSEASNGTSMAFNTTSDEGFKNFIGEYDWQEAFRIIKADPVRDFTWKSSGGYAVGWGAQTSYAVSPDLATPGGWFDADGNPCEKGTNGATYLPWGVDQGKRTPYLWAAVSHLIDEVAALKAELSALRI